MYISARKNCTSNIATSVLVLIPGPSNYVAYSSVQNQFSALCLVQTPEKYLLSLFVLKNCTKDWPVGTHKYRK